MSTTTVDLAEPEVTPEKAPVIQQQHASPVGPVDKFAEARKAKKKARRATHRAKLRRSHTNG
jgi:hypothetical protein